MTKHRSNLRDSILEAAEQLFIEVGYDNTTLRKLANLVRCNPATIYNYFKNKEAIFYQLQSRAFEHFHREFDDIRTSTELNGIEKLILLNRKYINFALGNSRKYELMFILRKPMDFAGQIDPQWSNGQKNYELLKETISQCIEEKSISLDNVDSSAFLLWSTVHGMVSLIIRNRTQMIHPDDLDFILRDAHMSFEKLLKK